MTKNSDGLLYKQDSLTTDGGAWKSCSLDTSSPATASRGRREASAGWEREGGRPSGQHQGQELQAVKML